MWKPIFAVLGVVCSLGAAVAQDRLGEFVELARSAHAFDNDCIKHGGVPMEYDEKAWRRGKQEDNVVHASDGVFVTYAYESTKWLVIPTIRIKHCRFPLR